MIKSMTGFGQVARRAKGVKIKVEIRTLNNRFFDNTNKLPEQFYVFEDRIRNLIQKKIKRGKVNLNVVCEEENKKVRISIDEKAARRYYNQLRRLKRLLGLTGEIDLENIAAYPGIICYRTEDHEAKKLWPLLEEGIQRALEELLQDRLREGTVLSKDLNKRIKSIERVLTMINDRSSLNIEQYRHRLARRVKDLSNDKELDKTRLETEVAIFAKNCDIQEEITRISGHAKSFRQCLKTNGEVGKKLDFIAQELHREINTIGSKSSDFKISQGVIQIKSEIEKIREQVKNIE